MYKNSKIETGMVYAVMKYSKMNKSLVHDYLQKGGVDHTFYFSNLLLPGRQLKGKDWHTVDKSCQTIS